MGYFLLALCGGHPGCKVPHVGSVPEHQRPASRARRHAAQDELSHISIACTTATAATRTTKNKSNSNIDRDTNSNNDDSYGNSNSQQQQQKQRHQQWQQLQLQHKLPPLPSPPPLLLSTPPVLELRLQPLLLFLKRGTFSCFQ